MVHICSSCGMGSSAAQCLQHEHVFATRLYANLENPKCASCRSHAKLSLWIHTDAIFGYSIYVVYDARTAQPFGINSAVAFGVEAAQAFGTAYAPAFGTNSSQRCGTSALGLRPRSAPICLQFVYQIGSHFWVPNLLPFWGIKSVSIFGHTIGSHFWVPNRLPFLGTKSVTSFGYQIGYHFWVPIRCHILDA